MNHTFIVFCLILGFLSSCNNQNSVNQNNNDKDTLSVDTVIEKKVEPEIQYQRDLNDWARILAGLEPLEGSTTTEFDSLPAVIKHRERFNQLFKQKQENQLIPLQKFVSEEMEEAHKSDRNVYYPFAGADVVTIHTIYPNAKNYVMFGLEIEGKIPDLTKIPKNRLDYNLKNLNQSISHLMSLSFFMTKSMAGDFIRSDFQGTAPILLAFISRMGNEVLTAEHVKLTKEGQIVTYNPEEEKIKQGPWDDVMTGIQFKFRKDKASPVQILTYFCLNIANENMEKNPEFLKFLDTYKPTNTYVKAASYLMHGANYSIIKNKLLEITQVLLQDDSGVPYRFFKNDNWKVTLYGKYNGPIPLFKSHFQRDYLKDYQDNKDKIRDLDFGIGYVYTKGRSNLMKAEKLKQISFVKDEKSEIKKESKISAN